MKTDEKSTKRTGRRFNVLDVVILLLLLAAIAAIGYRYYQSAKEAETDTQQPVLVAFEIKDLPAEAVWALGKDAVYLDSTGDLLGVLQIPKNATGGSVLSTRPVQVTVQDEKGNYVTVDSPDASRVSATGTVKCMGRMNEDGSFLLNGTTPVTPGQVIAVHTEKASFVLTVTAVPVK